VVAHIRPLSREVVTAIYGMSGHDAQPPADHDDSEK
jgi:hypothetical protein